MQDDEFEWGDAKAAINWLDHGVTFEMAREAFKDPFAIEWIDERQALNEPRLTILAIVEGRILFVGYTPRGERIRIISAWKAEPHERRRYHNESRKIWLEPLRRADGC